MSYQTRAHAPSITLTAASLAALAGLAGCVTPAKMPGSAAAPTAAAPLQSWDYKRSGAVTFLECRYGKSGMLGLLGSQKVAFFSNGPNQTGVSPPGGAQLVPINRSSCPRDSLALAKVLADVTPPEGSSSQRLLPRGAGGALVDPDRLWTDWQNAQRTRSWDYTPMVTLLDQLMEKHGKGIAALADYLAGMPTDTSALVAGSAQFPVARMSSMATDTLKTLEAIQQAALREYPGSRAAGIEAALVPYAEAIGSLRSSNAKLSTVMTQRQNLDAARREAERQARINADHCANTSKVKQGEEPSESEMCSAVLDLLRFNARGYQFTLKLMRGAFGTTIMDLAKPQGANLDVVGLDFRKNGACQAVSVGLSYHCRFNSRVEFDNNRLMGELAKMGIGALPSAGRFDRQKDGRWKLAEDPS